MYTSVDSPVRLLVMYVCCKHTYITVNWLSWLQLNTSRKVAQIPEQLCLGMSVVQRVVSTQQYVHTTTQWNACMYLVIIFISCKV